MPYFVRIGVISSNQSGVGSRGYYVRRETRLVVVRWGGVRVERVGNVSHFFWANGWPATRKYKFRNDADAESWASSKVAEKLGGGTRTGNYEKLPPGRKIEVATRW